MKCCISTMYRRPTLIADFLAIFMLITWCHAEPSEPGSLLALPIDEQYGYNDVLAKRAPSSSGFHGMRGKKDFDVDDKRAPASGFVGMRGKKFSDLDPEIDLYEKRAPSASGFVGMRGKKFSDLDAEMDLYDKRAPSAMGFQGMRGKKGGFPDDGDFYNSDKRVGFVGMRGKKDPAVSNEESADEILELQNILLGNDAAYKRAPSSGFLGLRGKKAPSQGFLGLRGKKAPADSSFFGMRGKKSDAELTLPELLGVRVSDTKDLDDLLYYLSTGLGEGNLRQKRYPNNIKKKPSGFLGMRGKKYWIDSKDVALVENSESAQ